MTNLWFLSGRYVWVYQGCFWRCIWHDKCCLSWQTFDFYQGYTFVFIKAVSATVFHMIIAVYDDKPFWFLLGLHFDTTISYKFLKWYFLLSDIQLPNPIVKFDLAQTVVVTKMNNPWSFYIQVFNSSYNLFMEELWFVIFYFFYLKFSYKMSESSDRGCLSFQTVYHLADYTVQ